MNVIFVVFTVIFGIMASMNILFYPQDDDYDKIIKVGCYLGNTGGVILTIVIITTLFS